MQPQNSGPFANKLVAELKIDEGTVRDAQGQHKAYRCPAGKLTIGYGHNMDAAPLPGWQPGSTLTEPQAEALLLEDIANAQKKLDAALPWAATLDAARYAALINMCFNMGIGTLQTFKNTLASMQKGDFEAAAHNLWASRWARQVGDGPGKRMDRAERLIEQIRTGVWL